MAYLEQTRLGLMGSKHELERKISQLEDRIQKRDAGVVDGAKGR